MKRRELLHTGVALAAAGIISPTSAGAYVRCVPAPNPSGQLCEAGVPTPTFVGTYLQQVQPMWCWAASVEMIFRHYGYEVSQDRIVSEAFGSVVNLPASGTLISQQLSRDWISDDGRSFRAELEGVYDADAGVISLTNRAIVNSLADERPMIMGTINHAMVLASVAYIPAFPEPFIVNVGLLDPFPGVGPRGAQSALEMKPMHMGGMLRYLALPSVSPL